MILESKGGWSETSLLLHLLRGTFTMAVYRYGERYANNPAEKVLFARSMQDKARHLAYSLQHLRYAVTHKDDKALVFERLLNIGERVFVRELQEPALLEPMAIVFGGGIEGSDGRFAAGQADDGGLGPWLPGDGRVDRHPAWSRLPQRACPVPGGLACRCSRQWEWFDAVRQGVQLQRVGAWRRRRYLRRQSRSPGGRIDLSPCVRRIRVRVCNEDRRVGPGINRLLSRHVPRGLGGHAGEHPGERERPTSTTR